MAHLTVTGVDDCPTLIEIFSVSHAYAKLDPQGLSDAALLVDEAIATYTPDQQVQILSFLLMVRLGIRFAACN